MKWYEFKPQTQNNNVVFSVASIYRNLEKYPFMSRLSSGSSASCAKINEISEKIYESLIPYGYDKISTDGIGHGFFSLSDDSLAIDYILSVCGSADKLPQNIFYFGEGKNIFVAPCSREHLAVSAVYPSLSVENALEDALDTEEKIESECPFAFDSSLGYLMKDADSCGCGVTLGAMLFLPMCDNYSKSNELKVMADSYLCEITPVFPSASLYKLSKEITRGIDEREGAEAFLELVGKICALEEGLASYLLGREKDAALLREQCACAKFIASNSSLITPNDFFEIYRSLRVDRIMFSDESEEKSTVDLDRLLYLLTVCAAAKGQSDLELCRALSAKLSESLSPVPVQ